MVKQNRNLILKLEIFAVISALLLGSIVPAIGAYNIMTENVNEEVITIEKEDLYNVDFHVSIGDITISSIEGNGDIYDRLSMDSCGYTADYGKTELPIMSYYVAVPQGAQVSLEYEVSDPVLSEGYYIYPSQPPMPETGGYVDPPFTKNESYYSKDEFYPDSNVEITSEVIMRGCRIIRVTVYPFIYNPVTKLLKKYEEIDISINFVGGTEEFIPERLRSIYFQPFFDAYLINAQSVERAEVNNPKNIEAMSREDRADLLIVTYDDFYEEILPLAEWRHQTGIETKVVKWSEIGSSAEDLRNYMSDAYDNWELPPSFLLIVGDADHVPVNYLYTHPYHYTLTGTDHWYVAVDGTDYLPEMHTGRISVENEDELTTVVNKILDYSKTPYMDKNWFDDVLLAAKEEYGRFFVYTSERLYDFLNPLGYTCDRQYQGTTPPGSTQGVIDAINNGVIIANHRDHGAAENDDYSYTGWSAPQFDTTHIQNDLTNGEMYPIMYALHCDSGWFDGETDSNSGNWESIGEIGIRVADKGFVAVIASTRVSYSGYNDELCVGLYDAMWSDFDPDYPNGGSSNPYETEVYRISQVMNYGKFWMYDKYIVPGGCNPYPWAPSEAASRTEFEMFHVHGDPTMEVWTWMPKNLEVTYEILENSAEVTVSNSGDPVENALVCLCQENGIYIKGLTDDTGAVTLTITDPSEEEITMIVTAHNYLYDQKNFYWNQAPTQPSEPSGPGSGEKDVEYDFSTSSSDPEGTSLSYWFDWGDGTNSGWLGLYNSGETCTASHAWTERGGFDIKVKVKDEDGIESIWSEEVKIWISNIQPGKPKIKGPMFFVEPGVPQEYTFTATDPDGDQVYIKVIWDSGSGSWDGPLDSGESLTLSHTWEDPQAKYTIRAQAKDIFGYEGEWATLTVRTPRNRGLYFGLFEILADNFPILSRLFTPLFF